MPLNGTNTATAVYLVHDEVTNINCSTQFLANVCQAMSRSLPKKTSAQMKTTLMDRCQDIFQTSRVHLDSRDSNEEPREAKDAEYGMSLSNHENAVKQRQKRGNSARFMGELWTAGIIHDFFNKLLNYANDFSMDCFCAFDKAVGEDLEDHTSQQ